MVEGPLEAAGLVPPAGGVGVGGAALAAEGAPRGGEVVARGTRRRLGQERDDLRRVADADLRGAVDEGAGQAGMEPDPRQGAAAVRDADLPGAGGGPEGTDGAERPEGVAGRLQRGGRRRVQEGQAPRVRVAPARGLQCEAGEVGELDLGPGAGGQPVVLGLGPAAVDGSGGLAPGAARALPGGGAGRADGRQGAEPAGVVGAGLAGETGVHDRPDPGDGEARLGHGGGEDDTAPPGGGEDRVLHRLRRLPVHLQDVGGDVAEHARDTRDLPDAGQEAQDVAVPFGQRAADGRGDVPEERRVDAHAVGRLHGPLRRRPDRLDRMERRRRLHHRRVAEQARPGTGVGRRGRRHHAQVGPQRRPHVQDERQRGVGVQVPLVALVQDHRADAGELRLRLEALQHDAGGDDVDVRAGAGLAADGDADPAADALAQEPGHVAGGRAGGEAARLQDQDLPRGGRAAEREPGERERDEGGLPGPRRRRQHGRAAVVQRRAQVRDGGADGESLGVADVHPTSVPRPRGPAGGRCRSVIGRAGTAIEMKRAPRVAVIVAPCLSAIRGER